MYHSNVNGEKLYKALVRTAEYFAHWLNTNGSYAHYSNAKEQTCEVFLKDDCEFYNVEHEFYANSIVVQKVDSKTISYSLTVGDFDCGFEVLFEYKPCDFYHVSDISMYGYKHMEYTNSYPWGCLKEFFTKLYEELSDHKEKVEYLKERVSELEEENEKLKESVAMLKVK